MKHFVFNKLVFMLVLIESSLIFFLMFNMQGKEIKLYYYYFNYNLYSFKF
jgi:hypothetical protein